MSSAKTSCVLNQCGGPAAKHDTATCSLPPMQDGGDNRKSRSEKTHDFA